MKQLSIFQKFSNKETLAPAQAIQIKGGDDKRPPLHLPNPGPTPPPPPPNAQVCYI